METWTAFGAIVAAGVALSGVLWGVARFFIYASLARTISIEIKRCEFADESRKVAFAEVELKNVSRVRMPVSSIMYRAVEPIVFSYDEFVLRRSLTEWNVTTEDLSTWSPGESQQLVIPIAWPKGRVSVPVQFVISYLDAPDVDGFRAMALRLMRLRVAKREPISIVVSRLAYIGIRRETGDARAA